MPGRLNPMMDDITKDPTPTPVSDPWGITSSPGKKVPSGSLKLTRIR